MGETITGFFLYLFFTGGMDSPLGNEINSGNFEITEREYKFSVTYLKRFGIKRNGEVFRIAGFVNGHKFIGRGDDRPLMAFPVDFLFLWIVSDNTDKKIFAEKQEGIKETKALLGILSPDTLGLSKSFCSDIKASIQGMEDFAIFCDAVTRAMYLTSYAEKTHAADDIAAAVSTEKEPSHKPLKVYCPRTIRI